MIDSNEAAHVWGVSSSPFGEITARSAERVGALDLRQQVAFFTAAAKTLAPGYQQWLIATGPRSRVARLVATLCPILPR